MVKLQRECKYSQVGNLPRMAWIILRLTSGRKYHIIDGERGASGAANAVTTREPCG